MTKRLYTDRDYLEQRFNSLEKILTEIKEVNVTYGKRIGILEKWKDEIVIKTGVVAAIIAAAFTLFKDWLLEKLGFKS
jgi:hypothetical protein